MNQKNIIPIGAITSIICIMCVACFLLHNYYTNPLSETEKQSNLESSNEKCEYLVAISQKDLNKKLEKKDSFWVYIGRPSCPDCQRFSPRLEKLLTSKKKNLFYYNTTCKVSKKKEMKAYVKGLQVHEIPAILKVEKGKITVLDMQTESNVKQFEKEF